MKSHLKSLILEDFGISFLNFYSEEEDLLPNLEELKINAFLFGSQNLLNFIQALNKSTKNVKTCFEELNVSKCLLENNNSCIDFFKVLFSQFDKKLFATLEVDVQLVDSKFFERNLLKYVSRKKKMPNFSLDFRNVLQLSNETKLKLNEAFKKNRRFLKKLNISGRSQRIIFTSENGEFED